MLLHADLAKLVLRLTLGVLMLFHGAAKLMHGVDGIASMLQGAGLPGFFAYGVYFGEVIAPLMLIFGFYARVGALLIVANMLVAITLAHMGDLFALSGHGGWRLELQGFFLMNAVTIFFLGAGKYKIKDI